MSLFSGEMARLNPFSVEISFFRAGHTHAGVFVVLGLLRQIFVEHAALSTPCAWFVRIGVPLAAIVIPLGSFISPGSPE
jgi:hypothetical protein